MDIVSTIGLVFGQVRVPNIVFHVAILAISREFQAVIFEIAMKRSTVDSPKAFGFGHEIQIIEFFLMVNLTL